ncbi:hypothetical protein DM02DRAFT_559162 [Periconia macrospinosa]|uniref:Zn(2)-C6 fungal-type domain-containing protein n=1 Tax=Periconia macrospinosa TaxID=97972 RepID=A0A2V1DZP9_9PLEO|nr:hypothetical protein DM02DRAFT_559162 [Periconia macrospinosa]
MYNSSSAPHSPGSAIKPPSSGRHRVISSCLTCRRRKVRCDHVHPVCGACARGSHLCTYATDGNSAPTTAASRHRIFKSSTTTSGMAAGGADIQGRLERLERLLEKAVSVRPAQPSTKKEFADDQVKYDQVSPSDSQTSQPGMSSDNQDGTLLLDGEQTRFVSSLHYALLADEIQDIKALLSVQDEERHDEPTRNNLVHLLSLGKARISQTLGQFLPESQKHRDILLDVFFTNVDPMLHITHKPTLTRKFSAYLRETHPMSFAVFYASVNALPATVVENKFGEKKEELLAKFELGVEIGLARENYLTTSSLEVFQAFVIWLTCITKEEDMGKAWTLLGVAIRIALNQGLHRDPSLFPAGSWDAVTIELRRRTWHQVCHLEFRAAECKGQEPSISEDDYTTLLPRNIEDEELIEGASPGASPYDEGKFTSITFQIVRFIGMRALRHIIKSTYRLERRMLESGLHGTSGPDPAQELRDIYEQIKTMVNNMHEEKYRKYLRFCNPEVPLQRLVLGLSSLMEWRCYLLFWLRMPRAYRDLVFSSEIRKSIFEKSVNCIETLNNASVDVDAARFQWHIGSHSTFQAIMHILSELRNPLFDAPDRQRALRALELSRLIKETNHTKPWQAIKSMIDKLLSNSQSDNSTSVADRVSMPAIANTSLEINPSLYAPSHESSYTAPDDVAQLVTSQAQSQIQSPFQTSQPDQMQFNWDDLNLNDIVGMPENGSRNDMPEFDFGFWGDPINFGNEQMITFPTDTELYTPWNF